MKKVLIKKGQRLQSAGELNSKVYYVHSGLLRSYSIDEKGKEHIYMFASEGWAMADSVTPTLPCTLFIDALEDSIVDVIEKDTEKIGAEKRVNPTKFRKRLWVLQERIIMLMSSTAIERYDHFLETYPDIVQRVPQRMIASYLGITPEALSKVKSKRIKKLKS